MLAATLPLWHAQTARKMLYPLFSSAPTRALSASVPATAIMLLLLVAISTRKAARSLSWRTLWLVFGAWKVLTDPLIVNLGEVLMRRGLGPGVVFGRILVDAVPNVATWIWVLNSFNCKERAHWIPNWFLPFALLASQVRPFELPRLGCVPECYIIHGIVLSALALLSPSSEPRKVPRSSQHPHPPQQIAHSPLPSRLFALVSLVALAHFAARFSTHCPTSPSLSAGDGLLASRKSVTGWISVGEHDMPGLGSDDDHLTMRYLRADHSLLGGLWVGRSRRELERRKAARQEATEKDVVRNAEAIYSTFLLQELVRLVIRPPELPSKKPEQGLVIGLGAGLSARALYQHKVNLTLVEIDPAVYDFAVAYFGVDEVRAGDVVLEDAVTWARRQDQAGRFDYIVHDVFTGGSVPAALFAEPFLKDLYGLLHPSGVIAVNFAGDLASLSSLRILTTLLRVFPRCRAFSDGPPTPVVSPTDKADETFSNLVLLCTKDWLVNLELRDPIAGDYLPAGPSPRLREQVFSQFRSREVDLAAFRSKAASSDGDKWIIRTERDVRDVEREQLDEVGVHWKVMQEILPNHVWAKW